MSQNGYNCLVSDSDTIRFYIEINLYLSVFIYLTINGKNIMKSKLMKRLTYFFGALLLCMLMVVNIQVATSTENNIGNLNLLGLEASVFTPAAVATAYT